MTATLRTAELTLSASDTIEAALSRSHDAWMAEGDRLLGPMMDANATFWQRWAAVRYVEDLFQPRLRLEEELVDELHSFLTAEVNSRLEMQAERLERLYRDFKELSHRRCTAREIAHTTRELLEALRLWYAEIEFATGHIHLSDISRKANRLLERVKVGACAEWCCPN